MARRKGANKSKSVATRKTVLENAQTSKKNEKSKDDSGGRTQLSKMDETKKLSASTKVQNNHHLERSSNNLSTPNISFSSCGSSNTNGKPNYHRTNARTSVVATTTTKANNNNIIDSSSLAHRQVNDKHLTKPNVNEKDIMTNSSDVKNSTSSTQIMTNNNSDNSCNSVNNNNINNSCKNDDDALISTWNSLKYLHKKFKRIASATTLATDGGSGGGGDDNRNLLNSKDANDGKVTGSASSAATATADIAGSDYINHNGIETLNNGYNTPTEEDSRSRIHQVSANTNDHHPPKISSSSSTSNLVEPTATNSTGFINNSSNSISKDKLLASEVLQRIPLRLAPNVAASPQRLPSQSPLPADQNHMAGRHVCPYCNLNCTKPSVLQKHIRAHTNERPYPCDTCGFAFKTRSNYFKHCRSRAHGQRVKGIEPPPDADEGSFGSDQEQDPDFSNSSSDVFSRTASPMDERTLSPAAVGGLPHNMRVQSSPTPPSMPPQQQKFSNDKPYKPKFHNAALYVAAKEELPLSSTHQSTQLHVLTQINYPHSHNHSPLPQQILKPQIQHSVPTNYFSNPYHQQQDLYPHHVHQRPPHNSSPLNRDVVSPSIQIQIQHHQQQLPHNFTATSYAVQAHSKQSHRSNPIVSAVTLGMTVGSGAQSPQMFQQVVSPGILNGLGVGGGVTTKESTSSSSFANNKAVDGSTVANSAQPPNVEFMQEFKERISKIISQNEAIVENKELLLQKKYPKAALNRSKSVNNTMSTSGSSTGLAGLGPVASENATVKLAQSIVMKQHQQQQLLLQQRVGEDLLRMQQPINGLSSSVVLKTPQKLQSAAAVVVNNQFNIPSPRNSPAKVVASTFQPLNLSKPTESGAVDITKRRQSSVDDMLSNEVASTSKPQGRHPQNPERSIIKDLLLNARGLAVPSGEGEDAVYTCPLCKFEFRTADELKLHTSSYCQGTSSAPISPDGSPSYNYFRSASINMNLPELTNPNSLAKLARSSLLHLSKNPLSLAKLAWSQLKTKPSNLVLDQLNIVTNANAIAAENSPAQDIQDSTSLHQLIDAPLPSPGPLLGKTPLVEAYNHNDKRSEDVIITKVHDESSFEKDYGKRLKIDTSSAFHSQMPFNLPVIDIAKASSSGYSATTQPSSKNQYSVSGGDFLLLERKEDRMKRFVSSGGCVTPISECPDLEVSPKMIRTPLMSGGSFQEVSPKSKDSQIPTPSTTPKMLIPGTPLTPSLTTPMLLSTGFPIQHFQFPINSITAFNPLTLPPITVTASIAHGEKVIPYVPGIPGPNSQMAPLPPPPQNLLNPKEINRLAVSPNRKKTPSPMVSQDIQFSPRQKGEIEANNPSPFGGVNNVPSEFSRIPPPQSQRNIRNWSQMATLEVSKKSFNFTRIADNISPKKPIPRSPEKEVRHFNFENITKKPEIIIPQQSQMSPLHVDVAPKDPPVENHVAEDKPKRSKFLRPSSLPLKPGTFTPKRHHGITPTANTLPLISPETPRPSKACVQLYLNGHAYTYLGLKCSTKMFYCTVSCPQPSYVANLHKLSMYSVWQVCAVSNPHPLGFKPKTVMSLYDSRQRNHAFSMAGTPSYELVHSQPSVMTPFENSGGQFYHHQLKSLPLPLPSPTSSDSSSQKNESGTHQKQQLANSSSNSSQQVVVGGYESNEDYTYIRGRGRGRYVCSECGIRCKKPSMLKKHIRTHTDLRPYTCKHCSFSFKTKGNLTKHMQSKTHYKKCLELGINPGPMPIDGDFGDNDFDYDQQSITSGGGGTSSVPGESDSDDFSDNDDRETESSDTDESKSRLPEHEAARCLLSLSMTPPTNCVSPQHKGAYSYHHTEVPIASVLPPTNSTKRVVSFTSPKPPFDYQKQEQYYSNPEESKPKNSRIAERDDMPAKPIDLTKPRSVQQPVVQNLAQHLAQSPQVQYSTAKAKDVIGDFANESGMWKSLVSITDKVRVSNESSGTKLDENVLLQAYLTEQALKYTKIKQSQMSKTFSETTAVTATTTMTTAKFGVTSSTSTRMSFAVTTAVSVASTESHIHSISAEAARQNDLFDSLKRGTTTTISQLVDSKSESAIKFTSSSDLKEVRSKPTVGAKSVASEYLKITTQKTRPSKVDESDDSMSDQEMSSSEPISTSAVKPQTDFTGVLARTVIVGEDGFKNPSNEVQPVFPRVPISDDGRPVCTICSKTFQKQHQLVLHMNIHYMERKFKCEACGVSFRTQGHLQKHERSEAHKNKVMVTSTFGVPTTSNPRPFECTDCKIAFRIHGHLAKHLRSKTHVQKLECLQKLPFGTYAEIERAGISLTEIDTTDCENSLLSLKVLAQKLMEKDPSKLASYTTPSGMTDISMGSHESGSEDGPDGQIDVVNGGDGLSEDCSNSSTVGIKRKYSPVGSINGEMQDGQIDEKRKRSLEEVPSN